MALFRRVRYSRRLYVPPLLTMRRLTPFAGKSHMTQAMVTVAQRVEPDAAKQHPSPSDEFWQDRVQQWRNEFMKSAKAHQGKREDGGMDVSLSACLTLYGRG